MIDRILTATPHTPAVTFALVEPDAATWDSFVQAHPQGNLLQAGGWGALKAAFGWQQRRVAIADASGLRAGAQVLIRRRYGLSVAYVPRGPLFSGDEALDSVLLAALDRVARRARAVFLRLEPNMLEDAPSADARHSWLLVKGWQPADPLQPRSSVHLDLAPEPERLLAACSKGHRADIRRAARAGVTVRAGTAPTDLVAFYAIMQATGARAQFGIHSYDYYRAFLERFAPGNAATLLLAEREGTPLATAVIGAWAGCGLYLYSGSTEEGLKHSAQHAIQWQALQWARAQGCTTYDFWGVPDAFGQAATVRDEAVRVQLEATAQNDPLYGVYRFKKGFGGRVVRYAPAYDRVYFGLLYRVWQRRFRN